MQRTGEDVAALVGWEDFYVIVGSASGALIGLQFVALTLIAQNPPRVTSSGASGAYLSPTVTHFTAALLLSAFATAPWRGLAPLALGWSISGVVGMLYALLVGWRMWTQRAYRPQWEDVVFHFGLPFVAYAMLGVSAWGVTTANHAGPFGGAASALLLLFVGIHNAWDTVEYNVFVARAEDSSPEGGSS